MANLSTPIICDGCGLPASPEHIAERLGRLEIATRFRPIHIHTLFVDLAPMDGIENDFYWPPASKDFFEAMMETAEISAAAEKPISESGTATSGSDAAKLAEFQHRGYYVSFLSECPIPINPDAASAAISRLGANLVRRIRFNYKPKQITLLGDGLAPLIEVLENAGLGTQLQVLGNRWQVAGKVETRGTTT